MSLIKKGDVVEYGEPYSWERRVGVVTMANRIGDPCVIVTEFGTGRTRLIEADEVTIIHGYLHIDRPTRRRF